MTPAALALAKYEASSIAARRGGLSAVGSNGRSIAARVLFSRMAMTKRDAMTPVMNGTTPSATRRSTIRGSVLGSTCASSRTAGGGWIRSPLLIASSKSDCFESA